jgi:hypothetical protein
VSLEVIQKLITSAGGKRFFMAMGAGIVNTLLLIFGFISPEIYRDLTIATVGVYIGAQTWEQVSARRSAGTDYQENPGA